MSWAFRSLSVIGLALMALALNIDSALAQTVSLDLGQGADSTGRLIQIVLLMTVLTLAPSILIMVTSFTRIVIVLSFVRTALGTQQTPPNQVIISLAMFLTFFIMMPTFEKVYDNGIQPLMEAIPAAESEFTDLLDVFNQALDHEVMITESISEILGLAHELRDFQSVAHLNTLMEEQTEEEALFNGIVSQIRRVGVDNGYGLFIMDQELKAMSTAPAPTPITI